MLGRLWTRVELTALALYPTDPAVNNSDQTRHSSRGPQTLGARLESSQRQCRREGKHPRRQRRHKVEIRVRHHLGWFRELVGGAAIYVNGRRATLTWLRSELPALRGRVGYRAPEPRAFDQLVARVLTTGPESGWGMRNPIPEAAHRSRWTPYYVPPREETHARAWLREARKLFAVLARIVAGAIELRPTTPHCSTGIEDYGVQGRSQERGPAWLEELRARRCQGQPPLPA